jgi:hypothetical protein
MFYKSERVKMGALGDRVIEMTPSSARVLERAAEILTPFPVCYFFNASASLTICENSSKYSSSGYLRHCTIAKVLTFVICHWTSVTTTRQGHLRLRRNGHCWKCSSNNADRPCRSPRVVTSPAKYNVPRALLDVQRSDTDRQLRSSMTSILKEGNIVDVPCVNALALNSGL